MRCPRSEAQPGSVFPRRRGSRRRWFRPAPRRGRSGRSSPEPRDGSAPPTPSSQIMHLQSAAARLDRGPVPRMPARAWRRWPAPRRRRSTRQPRLARAVGHARRARVCTGTAERRASAFRAGASPSCVRIAGWIPRDISRSSSSTSLMPPATLASSCLSSA